MKLEVVDIEPCHTEIRSSFSAYHLLRNHVDEVLSVVLYSPVGNTRSLLKIRLHMLYHVFLQNQSLSFLINYWRKQHNVFTCKDL